MPDGEYGLTVKEWLERLDKKLDGLASEVTALQILANVTRARMATAGAVVAVVVSVASGFVAYTGNREGHTNHAELCSYIDTRDDALRAQQLEQGRTILKDFPNLIRTKRQRQIAYDRAREQYVSLQRTRPTFCAPLDLPAFPPIDEYFGRP